MAKYIVGKFKCGHTGEIYVNGWNSKRLKENAAARFSGEDCPHCKGIKEYEKAVDHAHALKLPDLAHEDEDVLISGTVIRDKMIRTFTTEIMAFDKSLSIFQWGSDDLTELASDPNYDFVTLMRYNNLIGSRYNSNLSQLETVFLGVLHRYTDAMYWVESRAAVNAKRFWGWLYDFLADQKVKEEIVPDTVKEEEQKEELDLMVRPEDLKKDGSVVVKSYSEDGGSYVGFVYEYDSDFISLMKSHKCKWSSVNECWGLKITERSGSTDDRVAEIGSDLLKNGYIVKFMNENQINLAVSGEWAQRQKRWIGASVNNQYLYITLGERNDTLYKQAMKITGAKWVRESCNIRVLTKHYRQVEDFANTLDFSIDSNARAAIDELKEKESAIQVRSVKGKKEQESISVNEALKQKKSKDSTIIESLRDDD